MEIIECTCNTDTGRWHAIDCPCREITAPKRATKAFEVAYKYDSQPQEHPRFTAFVFAHNQEHAEFVALERYASDGWEVLSVERPRDGWGKVTTKFDRAA